ncbi:MAG: FecR family protein, partial [Spirochaetota bacterium]
MKTLLRYVYLMLFAGGLCSSAYAQDGFFSGVVDYLEGDVSVHRNGEIMEWPEVDIGLDLERYDLVETGMDGYAEVLVTRETGNESLVRVMQDTAFYFTVESVSTGDRVRFELMGGSLGLKVQKLTGTEVTVATESAVLGVRGTEFTVTVAPEGSILVTCTEGRVVCRNALGQEFLAEPGSAVEQLRNKQLRRLSVDPETIRGFADDWYRQNLEGFIPNAPAVIKGYARQYLEYLDRFNPAYQ